MRRHQRDETARRADWRPWLSSHALRSPSSFDETIVVARMEPPE
jgi:hypothetical protein